MFDTIIAFLQPSEGKYTQKKPLIENRVYFKQYLASTPSSGLCYNDQHIFVYKLSNVLLFYSFFHAFKDQITLYLVSWQDVPKDYVYFVVYCISCSLLLFIF